jgi:hypothetical protein
MRAEQDARQPARQSKAHPDCRSATIKSRFTKISLALSPGRNNHHPAATAKMAILIVAVFPSRLSRYTKSYSYRYPVDIHGKEIPLGVEVLDLEALKDVMDGVGGYFTGSDGYLDHLEGGGP